MNKLTRTLAAIGTAAVVSAGAFTATTQTAQADPINQWIWALPNGTILGQCPVGYHPQWNRITDLNTTATFLVSTQSGSVPWKTVQAAIDSGQITSWTQFVYNFTSPEETEPDGYKPVKDQLYEGDCVKDGQSLKPGPYHGNGNSTPTVHRWTKTVQIDDEKVTNSAWFATQIAKADDDGLLKQGELKNLVYGTKAAKQHVKETSKIVTLVIDSAKAPTQAQWAAAASKAAGVTVTTAKQGAVTRANSDITYVWALATKSTAKSPFAGGPQTFIGTGIKK